MSPLHRKRLFKIAGKMRTVAYIRTKYDLAIEDMIKTQNASAPALKRARDIKELLERSGYSELSQRMDLVIDQVTALSDVVDSIRNLHSHGKLKYQG